jgi:hypothetical protein
MTMILLMKLPRYATRRRTISLIAIALLDHAHFVVSPDGLSTDRGLESLREL